MKHPKSRWRQRYRPIFERLLVEARDQQWNEDQLRAAIKARFGAMADGSHIYQMWLKEKKLCFRAFAEGRSITSYERWHRWANDAPSIPMPDPVDPNQTRMEL